MKLATLFHRHDIKKGILLVVSAWFCFSTLYMLSKLLGDKTTIPTMLFFRNVVGLAIVIPWVISKWPKSLEIKNFKVVLIRSVMGLLNLFFIFMAVSKISLVNTTLLNNSAPFFVPFILWFWLKTPIEHKLWPAVILGFIGIAFILQPDKRIFDIGAAYALLSGICLALTLVTMRMTSQSEKLFSFMLYFFTFGLVVTAPFAIMHWKIEGLMTLLGLLGIGLCSAAGQVLIFHGMRYAKTHQLAPFTYSAVIFSGIYELLIWGIIPPPLAYLGMIFIIAAGVWIVFLSRAPKD